MAIKVKELKDDAIIKIELNKSFYLMTKALSYYLFTLFPEAEREEQLTKTMQGSYVDLDDLQRGFYTIALLLAEIEKQAKDNNLYDEKEILEPGDPGYKAPNLN